MNQRIDELERLYAVATPGPWRYGDGPYGWDDGIIAGEKAPTFSEGVVITNSGRAGTSLSEANGAFIVALVNTWPELLTELRQMQAEIGRLRDMMALAAAAPGMDIARALLIATLERGERFILRGGSP